MKWLLLVGGLSACATAAPAELDPPGDSGGGVDAPPGPDAARPDAAPDAPPVKGPEEVTLKQTDAVTVATGRSITCANAFGTPLENAWYRVFQPEEHDLTGVFHVTKVQFGAERASDSPELTVAVGTYEGSGTGPTLKLSYIHLLKTATVTVPDSTNDLITVPISVDIPAGSKLLVKVAMPSLVLTGKYFSIGSTNSPETHSGYVQSTCNNDDENPPYVVTKFSANSHLVITVTGTK